MNYNEVPPTVKNLGKIANNNQALHTVKLELEGEKNGCLGSQ